MRRKRPTLREMDALSKLLAMLGETYEDECDSHRRTFRQLELAREALRRTEQAIFLKTRLPDDLPANAVAMARCQITIEHQAEVAEYTAHRELSARPRGGERVTGELAILYLDKSAEAVLEGPYLTLVSGNAAMRVAIVADCAEFLRQPGRSEGFGETFRFKGVRDGEHSAVESAQQMIREMRVGNVVFIMGVA